MRQLIFQLLFFLKTLIGWSQGLTPQQIAVLPQALEENSGMIALSADSLIFLNDSGNPPYLFLTDSSGNIIRQVYIQNFPNKDWEELAFDGKDEIFIGDFGNNNNDRTDLRIARVSLQAFLSQDSVEPNRILNISYARQQSFPPIATARHYDMEAMVFAGDSLRLFSKNRTAPFNGTVYQYNLPANTGTYALTPVDSFSTGTGLMFSYWVTAAAYNSNNGDLLLLGSDKVWRFSNGKAAHFFRTAQQTTYALGSLTQKEAIDFVSDSLIYISDEGSINGVQRLYKAHLPLFTLSRDELAVLPYELKLITKTAQDTLLMELQASTQVKLQFEVFSLEGERVQFGQFPEWPVGTHSFAIDITKLTPGSYVLNVLVNGQPNAYRFVKPYAAKTR